MILKVRLGTSGNNWKYLDNVRSVVCREITWKGDTVLVDEGTHSVRLDVADMDFVEWIDEAETGEVGVALYVRQAIRQDDPIVIVTNNEVYLMSDEGKTIERLN